MSLPSWVSSPLIWLGYPPCMQGTEGNSAEKFIKVHSHVTCVRFSLISAVPFLKMQNIKCEHNHLFPYSPFWTVDANANARRQV